MKSKTIKNNEVVTIEIKKSKFIGYAFYCENVNDANVVLKQLRQEHKKATHVCYAYVINSQEKASDDGEPQGTAGMPTLNVLIKEDITDCVVVVTRYFGGIKLGANGLVRAYSDSVKQALNKVEIINL